jgi:hypothetical protein
MKFMEFEVKRFLVFTSYTNGRDVVEVNGSTVGQRLDRLVKQFPSILSNGYLIIMVSCTVMLVFILWKECLSGGIG